MDPSPDLRELLLKQGTVTSAELARLLPGGPASSAALTLSRYEILEPLGEGGVAIVYRARDREIHRPVALKILRETSAMSPVARQRFQREAQVAGGLDHPNVVRVYDAHTEAEPMYLVMELVEGRPLNRLLADRNYELRPTLQLLVKVARGVAAAHEKGIVHRDLKPANIMVTPAGEPKVGDFGLAHLETSEDALTRTGTTIGTPMYMAPEQVSSRGGEGITPRTDVYALGAILYEILTGRPPHIGESLAEIYARTVNEDPVAPRRLNSTVPRELETIALKALERDPARRYATALEFGEDLRRHLGGESILARRAGPGRRLWKAARRRPAFSAALAVASAALLLVVAWRIQTAAEQRRELEGLERSALMLEREGKPAEALNRWIALENRQKGHPLARAKIRELELVLQAAERRRVAEVRLGEGRRAKEDYEALGLEHSRLKDERARLEKTIHPSDGPELKQPLWDLERKLQAIEDRMTARYQEFIAAFNAALRMDPGLDEARAALLDLYRSEKKFAELEGDLTQVRMFEKLIRSYEDAGTRPEEPALAAPAETGTVRLDSDPPGAALELFRYEEGPDRRQVPVRVRDLGICPLEATKLPVGNYLIVFRKEGCRDARYPLQVSWNGGHEATIRLFTEAEIGADFLHVPAGEFPFGYDDRALLSEGADVARTEDYFIARHEVTAAEYLEFLNDRAFHPAGEAARRAPRERPEGRPLWPLQGDRFALPDGSGPQPVTGISWHDASAYAAWRTRGGKRTYRLPTSAEWEKAARGVDARLFPWGNTFDWTFAKGGRSRKGEPALEAAGAFPKDESPYGVRDMAGGIREWCDSWFDETLGLRLARGGAWTDIDVVYFRIASRAALRPADVGPGLGFRLARTPDRR